VETPHGVKTTTSLAQNARSQSGAAQRAEGGKGEGFQSGSRALDEEGLRDSREERGRPPRVRCVSEQWREGLQRQSTTCQLSKRGGAASR